MQEHLEDVVDRGNVQIVVTRQLPSTRRKVHQKMILTMSLGVFWINYMCIWMLTNSTGPNCERKQWSSQDILIICVQKYSMAETMLTIQSTISFPAEDGYVHSFFYFDERNTPSTTCFIKCPMLPNQEKNSKIHH